MQEVFILRSPQDLRSQVAPYRVQQATLQGEPYVAGGAYKADSRVVLSTVGSTIVRQ